MGRKLFTTFHWSGSIEISPDYLNMQAWTDLFNIAILTGIALALIGWFMPLRERQDL